MATLSPTGGPRNQRPHNESHRSIPILPHAQQEPITYGNLCATPITEGGSLGSAIIGVDDTTEAGISRHLPGRTGTHQGKSRTPTRGIRQNTPNGLER